MHNTLYIRQNVLVRDIIVFFKNSPIRNTIIIAEYQIGTLPDSQTLIRDYHMALLPVYHLYWGFAVQSTQWGHVERGQFT